MLRCIRSQLLQLLRAREAREVWEVWEVWLPKHPPPPQPTYLFELPMCGGVDAGALLSCDPFLILFETLLQTSKHERECEAWRESKSVGCEAWREREKEGARARALVRKCRKESNGRRPPDSSHGVTCCYMLLQNPQFSPRTSF